jgi:hypothetical protein
VETKPGSVPGEVQGTVVQDLRQMPDAAVQVSGTIVEQASQVSREVSSVANRLVDDTRAHLRDRAETQLGQLADGLDLLHRQTRALAQGRLDDAGSLVGYVQEGADRLGDLAERIHKGGVEGAVVDVKRFARSRPVVFLMGSAVAGLAIGRLLRNEAAAVQGRRTQDQPPAGETAAVSAELDRDPALGLDPAAAEPGSGAPTRDAGQ